MTETSKAKKTDADEPKVKTNRYVIDGKDADGQPFESVTFAAPGVDGLVVVGDKGIEAEENSSLDMACALNPQLKRS